jgi:hypothetical protein
VTKGVDLDEEADLQFLDFLQMNDPIEDRFPVLVPGEIVVGDKEAAQPPASFARMICSMSSGVRRRDLRP